MSKGISLHIGLNRIDPAVYPGWATLRGAENDAREMQVVANGEGYLSSLLLSESATSNAILSGIENAAGQLVSGDIFLLSFSGHGREIQGSTTEPFNQSWVAYNRQILDDELYCMWRKFQKGVRIVVVSDSCFSGTILDRFFEFSREVSFPLAAVTTRSREVRDTDGISKKPTKEQAAAHYEKYSSQYGEIRKSLNSCRAQPPTEATILLLAACKADQEAIDGPNHGAFTERLLEVYRTGSFTNYREFFGLIVNSMSAQQTPQYYSISRDIQLLEARRPFDI
jgi:hypothetical protein